MHYLQVLLHVFRNLSKRYSFRGGVKFNFPEGPTAVVQKGVVVLQKEKVASIAL